MAHRLAFSGWMASGKDTVAAETLRLLGEERAVRMSYAQPIRAEVAQVLTLGRKGATLNEIADEQSCSEQEVARLYSILKDDLLQNPAIDPYERTADMRRALQYWGTDVRRRQDDNYWVTLSIADALEHAESGTSVYYTDMRFPNEVAALSAAGFYTARIDVSRRTQAARLRTRDSLNIEKRALNHPSETALDSYPSFHLRLSNDGNIETCAGTVASNYKDWMARTASIRQSKAIRP